MEDQPWMRGFTIATLLLSAGDVVIGLLDAIANGPQGLMLSIAGFLFAWGAFWLLKETDDFKRWSRLTSAQKALAILIMIPGVSLFVFVFIALAASKSESNRKLS